mgnify:FL=1
MQSEEKSAPDIPVRPDLLVGSVRPATRAEILAAIPPRSVTDAITNTFFDTPDMGSSKLRSFESVRNSVANMLALLQR